MAGLRLIGIAAILPILRTIGLNDQRDTARTSFVDRLGTLLAGSLVILGARTGGRQRLTLRIRSAKARTCQKSVGVFLDRPRTQQAVPVKRDDCPIRVGYEAPWIAPQRSRSPLRRQSIRIVAECLLGEPLACVSGDSACETGRSRNLTIVGAHTGTERLTVGLGGVDVALGKSKRATGNIGSDRDCPPSPAARRRRGDR
jgi:hypothetical protein